ncbi:MAG: FAD-dependent oxidoreductase [Alphaproteobacteria bacterium]|nr:FAD-dependent oxidoreductase [Alphaproteobacteria bacterium]
MTGTHVICGGGVAGLAAALCLADRRDGKSIILVERSDTLGGLLRTFDYGPHGRFDCGMHFWTETGHTAFDQRVRGLLPGDAWESLSGTRRDLSGLFFRGRLQVHSQFPDLRTLPDPERSACLADFFDHLNRLGGRMPSSPASGESFQTHARRRFGRLIADNYVIPIAERNHGLPGSQLDAMARFLPLLDRVIMFDEGAFGDLMKSDVLRGLLAFPEQQRLPAQYASKQGSLYPREYGIGGVIAALAAELKRLGVTIMTGAQITAVATSGRTVTSVTVRQGATTLNVGPIERLVWASPVVGLAPLLAIERGLSAPVSMRRTVLIHLALAHPPEIGGLYCFFVGDATRGTYRMTNYPAYCPAAARPGHYPVTLEMIVDTGRSKDPAALIADGIADARTFGLLRDGEQPVFSAAEVLPSGFPTLAIPAIAAFNAARAAVIDRALNNLTLTGILARPDLFFQTDILRDLVETLNG